jgi:hypothetical protein
MPTSPRETVVAATPCERALLFTCCRAAAAAALALAAAAEEPEAAAEEPEAVAEPEVVTAPEEAEAAAADDQEDEDATEVRGTLTLPAPMPSVVVAGVPLRMAFWYQGSLKRSGMQLSYPRDQSSALFGSGKESVPKLTERPSRSAEGPRTC